MDATSTGGAGQLRLKLEAEVANGHSAQLANWRSSEVWGDRPSGADSLDLIQEHKSLSFQGPEKPSSGLSEVAPADLEPEQRHLLANVGPTLAKWEEAVRDTRRFAAWMKASPEVDLGRDSHWRAVQDRLAGCAGWLEFRQVLTGSLAGSTRLHAATFCQHKTICRMCAIRRATKTLQAYVPKLKTVCRELPKRGRLVFATLTQRTGPDLGERLEAMQDSLSRLVKARANADRYRRSSSDALRPIAGGVFSVEVKRGTGSGEWHVHAHGLLAADVPLQFGAVRRVWSTIVGQDDAQTEFRNVPHLDENRLIGGALETFKYATKFDANLADRDRLDVYGATFGRRLLRSFGCFRGVDVPEHLVDEPLDWDTVEWASLVLRYRQGSFRPAKPVRQDLFDRWNRGDAIAQA